MCDSGMRSRIQQSCVLIIVHQWTLVDTRMRKHFGSSFSPRDARRGTIARYPGQGARRDNAGDNGRLEIGYKRGGKKRLATANSGADTANRILQIQRVGALFPLYRAATMGDKLHACSPGNTSLGRRTEPIPHCRCITGLYVRIYTPIDLRAPVHFE